MRESWGELVRRIRKLTPAHLLLGGYLTAEDFDKFRSFVERIKFEYLVVFTNEGQGVAHIIAVGDYIPFPWLQEQWTDIHNAYGVNIKKVRPYSKRKARKGVQPGHQRDQVYYPAGLASYLLNQYLANQDAIRWVQHSRGWVYPGFSKDWQRYKRSRKVGRHLDRDQMKDLIKGWHNYLDEKRLVQHTLLSE